MTVQERMLTLRLFEKQTRTPAYMKQLGVSIKIENKAVSYNHKEGEKSR